MFCMSMNLHITVEKEAFSEKVDPNKWRRLVRFLNDKEYDIISVTFNSFQESDKGETRKIILNISGDNVDKIVDLIKEYYDLKNDEIKDYSVKG